MNIYSKFLLRFIALLAFFLIAACSPQLHVSVEALPDYDAVFDRQSGWTGADGAYSVALDNDRILWLFGDTWYGEVKDGRHVNAVIVNNSIAVQSGPLPAAASIEFFSGRSPAGRQWAFIRPADGRGWYWIYHGIRAGEPLYLFIVKLERTADTGTFGFKIIGSVLGRVANSADPPTHWRLTRHRIPWAHFSAAGDTLFGSSLLKVNEYVYIYGTTEDVHGKIRRKSMILARVPESRLEQFDQWRFYSGGEWITDFKKSTRLCSDMANEFSVSFLPIIGKYVAVYTESGFSRNIALRFAPNPWGPWSEPRRIYACPEAEQSEDVFCYAAKGHPELAAAPDEIIVTYVASSLDFDKMAADASLYRLRFLSVRFNIDR